MLFHYHFWTPYLEETEKFYVENGFRVSQRIGKYSGEFQVFNFPLTWDDFREKKILFRIIEVRKGAVNITFGYGKKVIFDHIGFFVPKEEQIRICEKAEEMNWAVDRSERRTFITTPYQFRIELQTNKDVVDSLDKHAELERLILKTKIAGLDKDLSNLLGQSSSSVISEVGDKVTIKVAVITGISSDSVDPNGVKISNHF